MQLSACRRVCGAVRSNLWRSLRGSNLKTLAKNAFGPSAESAIQLVMTHAALMLVSLEKFRLLDVFFGRMYETPRRCSDFGPPRTHPCPGLSAENMVPAAVESRDFATLRCSFFAREKFSVNLSPSRLEIRDWLRPEIGTTGPIHQMYTDFTVSYASEAFGSRFAECYD